MVGQRERIEDAQILDAVWGYDADVESERTVSIQIRRLREKVEVNPSRPSLILTVPIMALAAIPLARVNPRQGRFYRLIPAVLGYMLYVGMLLVCRSAIEDHKGSLPWYLSMVWIHLSAGAVVFLLYFGGRLFRRRARS